jgi:3-deoxy-D-arabino-heptulosonate 7-phosphate (DAHP) synthase class II
MTQKEEFKEALKILEEIEENVSICCAVTMEPDEVLELIDKLKNFLNEKANK